VARQLVAQAPRPVEIVFTGLRPGEKLHEDLLGTGEVDVRPRHPLISQVQVPAFTSDIDHFVLTDGSAAVIVDSLRHLCEESTTPFTADAPSHSAFEPPTSAGASAGASAGRF